MNQLSKTSSNEELKSYFNTILKLSKASDKFPVNMDEVWPLVYVNRADAVRALKRDFVDGEDYNPLSQNADPENQSFNPNPKIDYFLSVSCLEYFIVKKVRPVFEVYRKVFHKTTGHADQLKEPTINDKLTVASWLSDFLHLNDNSKLTLAKSIADPLGLPTPDYTQSKGVLRSASDLLKENGCNIGTQAFNQKMIEYCYMVEFSRPSSKDGVKKFKSITEKGLTYGENQVNPNNPRSTQPLYYVDKFLDLLISLKLK